MKYENTLEFLNQKLKVARHSQDYVYAHDIEERIRQIYLEFTHPNGAKINALLPLNFLVQ
jgi:hypothetical protein